MVPQIKLIAAALLITGAFLAGYQVNEARHTRILLAETQRIAAKQAEIAKLQAERNKLAQQLEDEANAEPTAAPTCLSPSRVRRLNLR